MERPFNVAKTCGAKSTRRSACLSPFSFYPDGTMDSSATLVQLAPARAPVHRLLHGAYWFGRSTTRRVVVRRAFDMARSTTLNLADTIRRCPRAFRSGPSRRWCR